MLKKESGVTRRRFCREIGILGTTAFFLSLSAKTGLAAVDWGRGVPVLVYHNLSPDEGSDLYTSAEVFKAEMEYLNHNGYNVIPLRRLIDHMQGKVQITGKPVVITFDDGYQSTFTQALPVLQEYKMHVTVFVITAKIGTPGYMTWDDVWKMGTSGCVDIQGHTHDLHYEVFTEPTLKRIRPAVLGEGYLPELQQYETSGGFEYKLLQDFVLNREILKSKLNLDSVDMLSWPFGAYNERALGLAKKAGFSYFMTLLNGDNKTGGNPLHIRRKLCHGNLPRESFIKMI